ncbi:hypothetical protein ACVIIW_006906 [Bradyrhizobium sp. USDA 4449]
MVEGRRNRRIPDAGLEAADQRSRVCSARAGSSGVVSWIDAQQFRKVLQGRLGSKTRWGTDLTTVIEVDCSNRLLDQADLRMPHQNRELVQSVVL